MADNKSPTEAFNELQAGIAKDYAHIILHPTAKGMDSHADALIRNYIALTDMADSQEKHGMNRSAFFAQFGFADEAAFKDQLKILASDRFRKITDPSYDLAKESLSNDVNMMNAYLLLAEDKPKEHMTFTDKSERIFESLKEGYHPDYSQLRNNDKEKSPLVNPETHKAYSPDEILNMQATIEATELRKLLNQRAGVDAKAGPAFQRSAMPIDPSYFKAHADYQDDLRQATESMVFAAEPFPHPERLELLLDKAQKNGVISTKDIAPLLNDDSHVMQLYKDLQKNDVEALTRALNIIEGHATGVTLPTQPGPTPGDKSAKSPAVKTPGS